MGMSTLVPQYTAEEVRAFPDDGLRYEVIRGELFVTPAPGTRHQRIVREVGFRLHEYVETHGLGEVILSPYEVEFADDTAVQPDLLVLLTERQHLLTSKRLEGAPSLVVEVISYSSKRTDRLQKKQLYQEEGVAEYWIFDPSERRVERWRPGAELPELVTDELSWLPSSEVPPITLELKTIFEKADRGLAND